MSGFFFVTDIIIFLVLLYIISPIHLIYKYYNQYALQDYQQFLYYSIRRVIIFNISREYINNFTM